MKKMKTLLLAILFFAFVQGRAAWATEWSYFSNAWSSGGISTLQISGDNSTYGPVQVGNTVINGTLQVTGAFTQPSSYAGDLILENGEKISNATNGQVDVISNTATAAATILGLGSTGTSPADNDYNRIDFWGWNDNVTAGKTHFGYIDCVHTDITSTTLDSKYDFYLQTAGTSTPAKKYTLSGTDFSPAAYPQATLGAIASWGNITSGGTVTGEGFTVGTTHVTFENDEVLSNATDGAFALTFDEDAVELGDFQLRSSNASTSDNDNLVLSFWMKDDNATPAYRDFGKIRVVGTDITSTTLDSKLILSVQTASSGAPTDELVLTGAALAPNDSAGLNLGTTTEPYAVLYGGANPIITITTNTTLSAAQVRQCPIIRLAAAQNDTTITVTLPAASANYDGCRITFSDEDVTSGADLVIQAPSTVTINGGTAAKKYLHGLNSVAVGVCILQQTSSTTWVLPTPPTEAGIAEYTAIGLHTWRNDNS